jgi:hypothetical protein
MDRDSDRQPLIESHDGEEDFYIHDEEEQSAFDHQPGCDRTQARAYSKGEGDTRKLGLADEPPIVAPPMRSTIQSRETGM